MSKISVSYGYAKREFVPFSAVVSYAPARWLGEFVTGTYSTDRGRQRVICANVAAYMDDENVRVVHTETAPSGAVTVFYRYRNGDDTLYFAWIGDSRI